ncbi:MAG: rod shape-determining protein RodA [Candidatus Sungbacteria bacterium]|nr:rod shape-determining protein RodA [Candidatus Sungbacteria bacterium]
MIFKNFDWPLFVVTCLLIAIGLVSLWSLSPAVFFIRQVTWVVIGFGLFFAAAFLDYRIFRNHGGFILSMLFGALVLLILLLVIGSETRGVASWFRFGSVAFEPVELVKLILVLVLAKYWSGRHIEVFQFRHLLVSGIYVFLPASLVLLQPDLGSAVILSVLWVVMVMFAGIRLKHLVLFIFFFAVIAGLSWVFLLKPYQKDRVVAFLDPYRDPQGAGYNSIQAFIAVGSGGLWGKGIGFGTQSHLNFLPEAETDFIFAAFAEENGFFGVLILIGLFAFFIVRVLLVGFSAKDNFSKLFALGFSSIVFFQFLVHTGTNLGLMPVTGVTLPFVSYGGSSLVTLMIGTGILQSIKIHSRSDIM